ncbi:ABC transporter substrate-binding protein [Fusibacter ferrireducens]|uniref:ABC transporter substrate-binding protein n=1 Tax=Fusibacter ferrireducens TaxID=2785058 RepID=A0ABR9ZPY7_9FIRM|nr:ABC transporter substrate-binding protein [Fusibacter ferrireducens]MBF4692504.1 ABC transporter substrate-binding protein [Fusibacter ferrireducens]
MKRALSFLLSSVLVLSLMSGCTAQASQTASSASAQSNPSSNQEAEVVSAEPERTESVSSEPISDETTNDTETVADSSTVVFTDSVGREVEVPAQITKIAISGPLAQIAVFSLAPDKMIGIATPWSDVTESIMKPEYYNLPILGQLYGGKGELNLETLLASGAQVVIDVGEPKGSIVSDLDQLQEQTGIPFVHITANLDNMGNAYRLLGTLLDMKDEAEIRAVYCEETYLRTQTIANNVEKANLLYCLGDKGQNVIAKGSYHAELIDLLSNNLAVVEKPVSKGTGNEVDMEQILNWNPDVILFASGSIYDTVGNDPAWQDITAIKKGTYYEVPNGPYNWLGFPPSVQRYLGMLWMSQLLYPEEANYDLYREVANYFELFYHADLTESQYQELVSKSMLK